MKLFNSFFKTFQNKHNQKPNQASEKHDALIKAKMESITAFPNYHTNFRLKEKEVLIFVSQTEWNLTRQLCRQSIKNMLFEFSGSSGERINCLRIAFN